MSAAALFKTNRDNVNIQNEGTGEISTDIFHGIYNYAIHKNDK